MHNILQKILGNIADFFFGNALKHEESSLETFRTAIDEPHKAHTTQQHRKNDFEEIERSRAKLSIFSKALENGIAVLYLDPRVEGVKVPERFKGSDMLVLNYSYRFGLEDFSFDENHVSASLSFSKMPFYCVIPWSAVFGIGDTSGKEYYSFVENDPNVQKLQQPHSLEVLKSEKIEVDADSEVRAQERRKQFRLIKGGAH